MLSFCPSFWSILKAIIHSCARADGAAWNDAKQDWVPGLKPGSVKPLQVEPLGSGWALPAPLALANRFIICVYRGSSAGCRLATLFRIAPARAGVGIFVGMVLGRIKRRPSVSKKKKVLFLMIGPPIEPAHWFALEKGRPTPWLLLNQSLEFMVRPFHQYSALPWNVLVPDLVT